MPSVPSVPDPTAVPDHARRGLLRLLVVLALLIAYVSLYPFRFRTDLVLPEPPYSAVDMVANVLLFLPFGLLARWLSGVGHAADRATRNRLALWLLAGASLAAALQWLQLFVPGRLASLMDVGMNWIGLGCGAAMAPWLSPRRWQRLDTFWFDSRAGLLLIAWLSAQLSPFLPGEPGRAWLRQLFLFNSLDWQWWVFAGQVLGWWLIWSLLTLPRRIGVALVVLTLAVQPWLLGNVLRREELFAPLLAAGCLVAFGRQPRLLLVLVVAYLTGRGLQPFHWGPVGDFVWLPFTGVITTPFPHALAVLAEKAFWYGGLYELGCRLGWSPRRWLLLAMLGLLLLEIMQLGLPRHRAELTDPLLFGLMALLLKQVRETAGR